MHVQQKRTLKTACNQIGFKEFLSGNFLTFVPAIYDLVQPDTKTIYKDYITTNYRDLIYEDYHLIILKMYIFSFFRHWPFAVLLFCLTCFLSGEE